MKSTILISCETREQLIEHLKEVIKEVRAVPIIRFDHRDDIAISDANSDGAYIVVIKPQEL